MVLIPRSQRQVGTPGGEVLPSPSGQRVRTAGIAGETAAQLGKSLADIGFIAQKANDNAELENAAIDIESKISSMISSNSLSMQKPSEFVTSSNSEIDKLISDASKDIGFRNRNKFDLVSKRIKTNSQKQIASIGYKKTVDLSKAQFSVSRDSVNQEFLQGKITSEQAVKAVDALIQNRFDTGVFNAQQSINESKQYKTDIARLEFISTYEADPKGAVKKLEANPFLSAEQKIDIQFKMASRIEKVEKQQQREREERNEKIGDFAFRAADEGNLTFEEADQLRNNDIIKGADYRRILKRISQVGESGGVGDDELKNTLISDIAQDWQSVPKWFPRKLREDGKLNFDQEAEVIQAIINGQNNQTVRRTTAYRDAFGDLKTLYGADDLFSIYDVDKSQTINAAKQRFRQLVDEENMSPSQAYFQVQKEVPLPEGETSASIDDLKQRAIKAEQQLSDGTITQSQYDRRISNIMRLKNFQELRGRLEQSGKPNK